MQIEFVRSGGFAGIQLTASLDTQELDSEQVMAVEKMVEEADFFNLPEEIQAGSSAADRFIYHLTVSISEETHSVMVHEAGMPDRLRPLGGYLTTFALTRKNS